MNVDLYETVKDLSNRYDIESKDSFISVYLNRRQDKDYLKKRIRTCESLIDRSEQENFSKTIKKINDFLKDNKEKNIAIFVSEKHDFFISVPLPIEINNIFIVDSSPYIRPLARILDEWESFSLILLNSHQASVFSIELGIAERKKNLSSHIMSKHKKGGWSQARFQRLRKGAIHDFFSEIVDYIEKHVEDQIILAGPGIGKIQFKDQLPNHIEKQIVDVIDIDMDNEPELIKQGLRIISEKEDFESHILVDRLREEILKDGLAVYGFDETLQAAKRGQIDILIVEKDYKLKGCLCEHCQILKSGSVKDCPVCGGPTTEADVIEEIIEFANRTNARIEFTDDEDISNLGHIGGLLRYKI